MMFKRLFSLSAILIAVLAFTNSAATAFEVTTGPVKVAFVGLKTSEQEFGSVALIVDSTTGETSSTDRLPDLISPTTVSWTAATVSFSFRVNATTYQFNWAIGDSLLSNIRMAADTSDTPGFLKGLERFHIGKALLSGGKMTIIEAIGDRPQSTEFTLLHNALNLENVADGRIGTMAANGLALAGDIRDNQEQATLALNIERTTATGFDLAYPATAFSSTLADFSPDLTPAEYLRTLNAYAATGVGYDSLNLETITGVAVLDGKRYSLTVDSNHNSLYRGYAAGPASLNGLKFSTETGDSLSVGSISVTGYDLTEAAHDIRELLRTRPEIFDLETTDPSVFLSAMPPLDAGDLSIREIMVTANRKSLSLASLLVNDFRIDENHRLNFGFSVDDLALPASAFDGQEKESARKILDHAHLDQLTIDLNHHFTLDPKNLILTVNTLDVAMDGLAAFTSQFELTGLTLLPDGGNITYPKLAKAEITIINDQLLDAAITSVASGNRPPDSIRREAEQTLRNLQASMTTKPGKAVYDEIISFINGTPRLTMSLAPQNPVPVDQVAGLLALSADAAVQFLGLKVTAGP